MKIRARASSPSNSAPRVQEATDTEEQAPRPREPAQAMERQMCHTTLNSRKLEVRQGGDSDELERRTVYAVPQAERAMEIERQRQTEYERHDNIIRQIEVEAIRQAIRDTGSANRSAEISMARNTLEDAERLIEIYTRQKEVATETLARLGVDQSLPKTREPEGSGRRHGGCRR